MSWLISPLLSFSGIFPFGNHLFQELSLSGPILFRNFPFRDLSFSGTFPFGTYPFQELSLSGSILFRNFPFRDLSLSGSFPFRDLSFSGTFPFGTYPFQELSLSGLILFRNFPFRGPSWNFPVLMAMKQDACVATPTAVWWQPKHRIGRCCSELRSLRQNARIGSLVQKVNLEDATFPPAAMSAPLSMTALAAALISFG